MIKRISQLIILSLFAACMPATAQQENVTADLSVISTNLYAGQIFDLQITVTSSGFSLAKDMNLMNMSGQGIVSFEKFDELAPEQKVTDGLESEIRRFRCRTKALQPGNVTISPSLDVAIVQRRNTFFGTATTTSPRRIGVRPLSLAIKPVPVAGKPADFSGGIGNMTFEAACSPLEPAPGDLITVSCTITGTANTDEIKLPGYDKVPGFKVYEIRRIPAQNPDIIQYEQVLVAIQTNKTVVIPPLRFSFFEPDGGRYRTISKGPFRLNFKTGSLFRYDTYRPEEKENATEHKDAISAAITAGYQDVKKVSEETWKQAAVAVFLLCSAALLLGSVFRTIRSGPTLSKSAKAIRIILAVIMLAAITLGSYKVYVKAKSSKMDQHVTIHDDEGRIAPSMSAAATFHLPKGSKVQVTERYKNWIKIETDRMSGWISADTI